MNRRQGDEIAPDGGVGHAIGGASADDLGNEAAVDLRQAPALDERLKLRCKSPACDRWWRVVREIRAIERGLVEHARHDVADALDRRLYRKPARKRSEKPNEIKNGKIEMVDFGTRHRHLHLAFGKAKAGG